MSQALRCWVIEPCLCTHFPLKTIHIPRKHLHLPAPVVEVLVNSKKNTEVSSFLLVFKPLVASLRHC